MAAGGSSPQGRLRQLVATADPAQCEAKVAVVVGETDTWQETVQRCADAGVVDILTRRADDGGLEAPVVVDVDHGTWQRVAWIPLNDPGQARERGAALARLVTQDAALVVAPPADSLTEFLHGWLLGGYSFSMASTPPSDGGHLCVALDGESMTHVTALPTAVAVARDLANTPSNIKNPQWFVERVTELVADQGIAVEVLEDLSDFGGIAAVGGGSAQPPRLLILTLPGPRKKSPTVVLVGKGITFDSGGLSLKPADSMATMKTDMAGAAAVVGTMLALAADRGASADHRVVAIMPLAENMPSGSAYRPGDVVRHFGGRTTEVSNTDAEGRMVLADALVYAQQRFAPQILVDIATLTGAATLGLSREYAALYSGDEDLAAALVDAGAHSGDAVWRMPLQPEYERFVDSPIADAAQSATSSQAKAGSITAALFLQRFVAPEVRWAHLDIAGPARADKPKGVTSPGGTGFGVALLSSWLKSGISESR